jgi:ribosomal protein L37E
MDQQKPRVESRLNAAKNGRTRFIGGPCKKCGGIVRYTSAGQCVECAYDANKRIRETLRKARGD